MQKQPWSQSQIGFQDLVQVFLFSGDISHYFVDLSYDSAEQGCSTKEKKDAKDLRNNWLDSNMGIGKHCAIIIRVITSWFRT